MSGDEIRRKFLKYFEGEGHKIVESYSLVPHDDPTLLFTNAGMVQFKNVFLGLEKRDYNRAVTSQKCVRAGGKHNDLDTVGRTARHQTFFEMLGNFSFGDYFKSGAITYAWEFLTEVLNLPKEKLWITIYKDDDEAGKLWLELTDVSKKRILRLGDEDNFWQMGDTGPCGPCSEIIYDRGEKFKCEADNCAIGVCDCDRWLEIWNLVFMQYDRDESGKMTPLPKPSIDTGLGLERVASIMQNVNNNFETDLLWPIIQDLEARVGRKYHPGIEGFPHRVISDHVRTCVFLISDGVTPSNEGRGYVLRRILRRAVRFGKALGMDDPFLYQLVPAVMKIMGEAYPQIVDGSEQIKKTIHSEERRFHETLHEGMKVVEDILSRTRKEGRDIIAGSDAFLLYDTFGFPFDLMEDIAEERGFKVDKKGFEAAMDEQRSRARSSRVEKKALGDAKLYREMMLDFDVTEFIGYEEESVDTEIIFIAKDDKPVTEANKGDKLIVLLPVTPFYGESGGQVGDTGGMDTSTGKIRVLDTQIMPDGKIIHYGEVESGKVSVGQKVSAAVDNKRRKNIARNHTSTHLVHRALREVLGDHAEQRGSLVAPNRLRFDFSHEGAMTNEEISTVEKKVNNEISKALPVTALNTSLDKAKELGAVALFGEKYSDDVRVIKIGDYSTELCGGTHLNNSSEILALKIISESGIGSGLRRIEAITGEEVMDYYSEKERMLDSTAGILKTSPDKIEERARELVKDIKLLERELESFQSRLLNYEAEEYINEIVEIGGINVLARDVEVNDMEVLRSMADMLKDKIGTGVVLLGASPGDKTIFAAMATKDAVSRGVHAGKLVGEVAKITNGGGGGRPDMAQAGGKDPSKLKEAVDAVAEILERQITN
ncbi:MAG: alanine--tRNA ligase [Clostridia bacterium]|nr:alanine--tRNA ligase [Clostridia bacterium]